MGKNVFIEIFLAVDVFISAKIYVSKYEAPTITPNNEAKISKEVDSFIAADKSHINDNNAPKIAIGIGNAKIINKIIIRIFFFIFPLLSTMFDIFI